MTNISDKTDEFSLVLNAPEFMSINKNNAKLAPLESTEIILTINSSNPQVVDSYLSVYSKTYDKYYDVIPKHEYTINEKLNCLTRFNIYLFLILLLCAQKYSFIPLVFILLIICIHFINNNYNEEYENSLKKINNDSQNIPNNDVEYILETGKYDSNGKLIINKELNFADDFPFHTTIKKGTKPYKVRPDTSDKIRSSEKKRNYKRIQR